jgi:predicted dehydrogenase
MPASKTQAERSMPDRHLKLGLVGIGRWGSNYVRTIAALEGVQLAAAASNNPATASLVPPACRIVSRWQELIAAPDIDGIIIASPPASHVDILLAAIAAGKPVLVEKPVVLSRMDAQKIRAALEGRRSVILVDHIQLFQPAFRALVREMASEPIRAISASAGNHGPYREDISVLWDWAPHDLAMCLTLVPGAARVLRAARVATRPVDGAMAERIEVDLALAGGIPARIKLSNMDERHRWFAVESSTRTLVYNDEPPGKLRCFAPGANIHSPSGRAIPVDNELPLTRAVLEFAGAIRSQNFTRASIDLGLTIVDLIADIETHFGR